MSDKIKWREIVAKYEKPKISKSCWQLVNTLVPFVFLWALMYFSLSISYFLTLALSILTAGFMVRLFIISHDCGHGSFFKNQKTNDFWGIVTGILTLTPYKAWRREHARHHATSGNLNKRGTGDIWTLTVKEYLALSWKDKFKYRLYRNPLVLFGIGPLYMFVVGHRMMKDPTEAGKKSVRFTNLILILIVLFAILTIGLKAFLLIQTPLVIVGASAGVWLFYVQHQFEDTYWEEHKDWDFVSQAIEGSSFYKLPKVLQWFTGNIGFHHVHHLSSKIPNYSMEQCHKENEIFKQARVITLIDSLQTFKYKLWDEKDKQMVGFRHLKSYT